jgi:hypothetical protein
MRYYFLVKLKVFAHPFRTLNPFNATFLLKISHGSITETDLLPFYMVLLYSSSFSRLSIYRSKALENFQSCYVEAAFLLFS